MTTGVIQHVILSENYQLLCNLEKFPAKHIILLQKSFMIVVKVNY